MCVRLAVLACVCVCPRVRGAAMKAGKAKAGGAGKRPAASIKRAKKTPFTEAKLKKEKLKKYKETKLKKKYGRTKKFLTAGQGEEDDFYAKVFKGEVDAHADPLAGGVLPFTTDLAAAPPATTVPGRRARAPHAQARQSASSEAEDEGDEKREGDGTSPESTDEHTEHAEEEGKVARIPGNTKDTPSGVKADPFFKAKQAHSKKQQERQAAAAARAAAAAAQKERRRTSRRLTQRTHRGQPVMRNQLEHLMQQLKQSQK
mmetsp:Transcript_5886/g.15005  ORF Transcript_5886/g.15005 Transcript_5886/m.15005 type:complete len:259 (-) Transcript_5886:40-816(-)